MERNPVILQGWHPRDIWNMDETDQFFRALPNKSLTEASQSCTGGKKSKDRETCAFFVNASGGKEKPIIIGKSANPRCQRYPGQIAITMGVFQPAKSQPI